MPAANWIPGSWGRTESILNTSRDPDDSQKPETPSVRGGSIVIQEHVRLESLQGQESNSPVASEQTRQETPEPMDEADRTEHQLRSSLNVGSHVRSGPSNDPSLHENATSARKEPKVSYKKLAHSVTHELVEISIMRAEVAALLINWKEMENHTVYAHEEAISLENQPLTALCHFTMGMALYNQRKWALSYEAFRLAVPCGGTYKTPDEVDNWLEKTRDAVDTLYSRSVAPTSAMPQSSIPDSRATAASPSRWETLGELASATSTRVRTPDTPSSSQGNGEVSASDQASPPDETPSPSPTSLSQSTIQLDPGSDRRSHGTSVYRAHSPTPEDSRRVPSPLPRPNPQFILNVPSPPRVRSPRLYKPGTSPPPTLARHPSPSSRGREYHDPESPLSSGSALDLVQRGDEPGTIAPSEPRHQPFEVSNREDLKSTSRSPVSIGVPSSQRSSGPRMSSPKSSQGIERQISSYSTPEMTEQKHSSGTTGEPPISFKHEENQTEMAAGLPEATELLTGWRKLSPPSHQLKRSQTISSVDDSN